MASKLTYEQLEQRIKELEEQTTEYTQLKDALIESESRYRLLYHNALAAMYTVTLDGKPIAVNSVGLSMLGYASEEEFFEKFQWNNHWVNPDDREQMIQELVEKGEIYHYQALAQTTKGEQFWNEFSVRINSSNTIDVVAIDITERKRAEDALQESEERYRSLFEGVEDHLFVIDQDFRYTMVNPSALKAGGFAWEDVEGRGPCELFPEDAEFYLSQYRHVFKTGESTSFQRELRLPDGLHWYSVTLSPIKDKQRRVIALTGISRDITEHKQAEEALRKKEKELQMITDKIPGLVSYVDANGCYRFVNKQYEKWFGLSQKEIIGKHYKLILGNTAYKQIQKYIEKALSGEQVQFEELLPYKSGGTRWVHANYVPDIDKDGNVKGLFALVTDITERKQAEKALRESEETYHTLSANIPGMIYRARPDWSAIITSNSEKICGYSVDEFETQKVNWLELIHSDDKQWVFEEGSELQKKPMSIVQEYRIFAKDRSTRWVSDHKTSFFKEDGSFIGIDGIVYDITDRKIAEEDRERLFKAISIAKEAVSIQSPDLITVYENNAMANLFGYEKGELIGKHISILNADATLEATMRQIVEGIEKHGYWEGEVHNKRKDGSEFITYAATTAIKGKDGKIINFISTQHDITKQKQAIEQIERHNRELAILNKITTSVSSTLDLYKILEVALDEVLKIARMETGFIYLMEHQAKELVLATYRGASKEFAQQVHTFKMGESLTGRAAQSDEPIIANDITKDRRVTTSLVREERIHSFAAIPMKSKGKIQGVVCIASHKHHQFTHEEIQLYMSIADNIGIAIENARLYEETKLVEADLRESEAQKKAILDSSIDRIRLSDTDMRTIWANQTHARELNIAPEDLIGQTCYESFVKRNSPCPECPAQKALTSGKTEHTLLARPIPGNTDEKTYLDAYAVPLKDESGRIVHVLHVTRDITEQVLAEKRLQQSEEHYRELANSITDVFFAMDGSLRYTYWNKASEELTGIPANDAIGKSLFEIFPDNPETRKAERAYREVLKKRTSKGFLSEYALKGRRYFFDITAYPSRDGLSVFVKDITKQKEMELAFWESEKRYRSLFDGVPIGLYRETPDGKVLDANNAMVEIMDYPDRETVLRADTRELYMNQKDRDLFQDTVEKQGAIHGFETQLCRYDGTPVWVGINVRAVKNADGNILCYEGSMADITEQKQAEKKLRDSQYQLRSLADHLQSVREGERTAIAREIHDELGQALTGLKMDLSWLAKKIPKDQRQLLDKLHSMSELTSNTLRTVQRISTELRPGLLDDLGLVAAIEWQTEEFQNRTGIRCTLSVDPEDITLDEKRSTSLFRILQETLTNVARHAQATRVHVSLQEKDNHLELRVRDNGKGITKEQISDPKSFGLIGIKERVHSWGGKVTINGRPGKGTTVVVRKTGKD